VIGDPLLEGLSMFTRLVLEQGTWFADSLQYASRLEVTTRHSVQLVLDGGTAAVNNKNDHDIGSAGWWWIVE
jgi:hypothetical protein